ncbi:MAG: PQQ-binding-like beta-propeller repeat protein, partial [Polyangiaceae bacterium]
MAAGRVLRLRGDDEALELEARAVASGARLWSTEIPTGLPPAEKRLVGDVVRGGVAAGERYIAVSTGLTVHVLDAATGARLSSLHLAGRFPASHRLAVDGDRVYFDTEDESELPASVFHLHAVELPGGAEAWRSPALSGIVTDFPPIGVDADSILVSSSEILYALDRATGAVRWSWGWPLPAALVPMFVRPSPDEPLVVVAAAPSDAAHGGPPPLVLFR